MFDAMFFLAVTSIFTLWLAPRAFHQADKIVSRVRVHALIQHSHPPHNTNLTKLSWSIPPRGDWPTVCDSLARSTRSGITTRSALHDSLQQHTAANDSLLSNIHSVNSLDEFFTQIAPHSDSRVDNDGLYALSLIQLSYVRGNFVPQSLDNAARILRDIRQCKQEAKTAAAQAKLSARILTVFPLIAILMGCVSSSAVRAGISRPAVLTLLLTGLVMNRLGWLWIRSLLHRTLQTSQQQEIFHIADHLCVSMLAGSSLRVSLFELPAQSPLARAIAQAIESGVSLSQALHPLSSHGSNFARNLAHLVITAETDGLPVVQSVHQLATEARIERRQILETHIRQLPTKLSLPLVMLILPSFLLCTLAPFVTVVLSSIVFPQSIT